MNVCIVGSSGLVGSQLRGLLSSKHKVIELNHHKCNVESFDVESLAKTLGNIDCIINCAAIFDQNDTAKLLSINSLGALNIAKLAVLLQAKLIHISSTSCEQHSDNEYFNSYGISKLAGELLIKDYLAKQNIEFSIVRCSQIYDLNWKACKNQPFFYNLISSANHNSKVIFYGNGDVKRNYVSLETVVNSIKYIAENKVDDFGYIIGETLRVSELIKKMSQALDKPIEIEWDKGKPSLKTIHIPYLCQNFSEHFQTNLISDIKEMVTNEKN